MITKSGSVRASAAARIFSTNSPASMTVLPVRWPQRLGNSWSSRWRPATPARWYSATVRCTLKALPKPVSASATSGMSSTAVMRAAWPAISVIVVKPRSGKPMSDIDTPAPVM